MRWRMWMVLLIVLSSASLAWADAAFERTYAERIRPFLKQHCLACHGADKQKGGVRFDGPMPNLIDAKVQEQWKAVKRLLAQGEMPPEGQPRPRADELIAVLNWIDEAGARAAVVTRGGVYLVERIFGIDIPSPPGNVDIKPLDVQLAEDKDLRKLTVSQHMERHRSQATCAVCHQRSDPLAFVWDEFDLYGQAKRDRMGKFLPFDVKGNLPDKTPFTSFEEFRKLLTQGEPGGTPFTVPFSERLLAYVLGRGLDHGDETHLKSVRAATAKEGGGVRSLLAAMVLSEPFRHK